MESLATPRCSATSATETQGSGARLSVFTLAVRLPQPPVVYKTLLKSTKIRLLFAAPLNRQSLRPQRAQCDVAPRVWPLPRARADQAVIASSIRAASVADS